MKKEYIIPGLLIIVLSAYLVMHNKNRDHYSLPFIPEITVSDIAEIAIKKDGREIVLAKKDEAWGVTDKQYPADQQTISTILDIIKDLKVTAVVSEASSHLNRYELDAKNRIIVTVKSKFETLREFEVGKAAPSYRHTFVRLKGSNAVYHAAKSFRRDFDKSVDDLRNKEVISFEKSKIKEITLKKDGIVANLVLEESSSPGVAADSNAEAADASDASAAPAKTDASDAETVKIWKIRQGDEGTHGELEKKDALNAMLSTLSNLKCSKFTQSDSKEESFKGMEKSVVITITGDKTYSLELFAKKGDESYPGLSSGSPYPFMLDTYQRDDLLSKVDEILGIAEKKEDADELPAAENSDQAMDNVVRQVIDKSVQLPKENTQVSQEEASQSPGKTAEKVEN